MGGSSIANGIEDIEDLSRKKALVPFTYIPELLVPMIIIKFWLKYYYAYMHTLTCTITEINCAEYKPVTDNPALMAVDLPVSEGPNASTAGQPE